MAKLVIIHWSQISDCILNFSDQKSFHLHLEQHKQAPAKSKSRTPAILNKTPEKKINFVKNNQQNLKLSDLDLNPDLSFDFEPIFVKTENVKIEQSTRANPGLPPGFKPVCFNKNGLVSRIGLAPSTSVKLEPVPDVIKDVEFFSDAIEINEEPIS